MYMFLPSFGLLLSWAKMCLLFVYVPTLFPSTSLKTGRSSGPKRKRSGAEMICDSFNGLVIAMSFRSTQSTAAQMRAAKKDAALTEAFTILNSMEQVIPGTALYCFAGQVYLRDKVNMTFFIMAHDNAICLELLIFALKLPVTNFSYLLY